MDAMTKLRNMLCEELKEIVEQDRVNEGSIGIIDRITHSIKSIDTIKAMQHKEPESEKVAEMKSMLQDEATRNALMKALSEIE